MDRASSARTIQRLIDDKYPNTRLIWQSLHATKGSRPVEGNANPIVFNRSAPADWSWDQIKREAPRSGLGTVAPRVIDLRSPETRQIWIRSREEPVDIQAAAQRLRMAGLSRLGAGSDLGRPSRTDETRPVPLSPRSGDPDRYPPRENRFGRVLSSFGVIGIALRDLVWKRA
jgi:hypothetical protein